MKLICDGLDLSNAVFKVIKAISSKTPNPVLEGIKLTAKGENFTLMATDTELFIEKTIRAEVFEEGETLVQGKLFSELIKKLENQQIDITLIENRELKIKYGDNEGIIQCMNVEEYPVIKKDINENFFTMQQSDFKEIISKTAFACAIDDARPILKGCKMEIENDTLVCVALDGFRLAVAKKELKQSSGNFNAIVPARALNEIVRLLDNDSDLLTVVIQDNLLMVEISNTVLTSRLLEGEYLNYRQIIPTDFMSVLRVNKSQMLDSFERASIVAKSTKNIVKLDIKEGLMNVSASSEIGNVNESIIINLEGRDIVIAFNPKYVIDVLRVVSDEFIHIYLNSSISPCIIKPFTGDEYLYLILPIRINA